MTFRFDELPEDSMAGHARAAEIRTSSDAFHLISGNDAPGLSPEVLLLAAIKLLNRTTPQALTPVDRALLKGAKVFFQELARLCDKEDIPATPEAASRTIRTPNEAPESVGPDSEPTSKTTGRAKKS